MDSGHGPFDIWWSLANVGLAADAARSALRDHGLPWLEHLATREAATVKHERDEQPVADVRALLGDDLDRLGIDPDAATRISEKMARFNEDHPRSEL